MQLIKWYCFLINFLLMNCKSTNLMFVFFLSLDHFFFPFSDDKMLARYPGGGSCGCESQSIPFYPRGGMFTSQGLLPSLPTPHYSLASSSGLDSLPGRGGVSTSHLKYTCFNDYTNIESLITNIGKYVIILKIFLAIF